MSNIAFERKPGQDGAKAAHPYYGDIASVIRRLWNSCNTEDTFDHIDPRPIPTQESVVRIIQKRRRILFPGYFGQSRSDPTDLEHSLGQQATELFDLLLEQILLSIQHDCLQYDQPCTRCRKHGHETTSRFIEALPEIRKTLATDVHAALQGDPAAKSFDEIVFSYSGLLAITVYRMAHELYELGIPLLPRMMSEYAHSLTGIDIHPGQE